MAKRAPATTQAQTKVRYDVYSVKDFTTSDGEERSDWRKIGVAFPHKNGNGFNVEFDLIPLDGRLVLRVHETKPDSTE